MTGDESGECGFQVSLYMCVTQFFFPCAYSALTIGPREACGVSVGSVTVSDIERLS